MSVHTISVFVENHSGTLSRIAGLFSSRGYNIGSLTVAETEDPTVSRMTIVVDGDEDILEQVVKQLNRLIDVIKVVDLSHEPMIERELVLVRVSATNSNRHEIATIAGLFHAKIVAVAASALTIEMTDNSSRIEDFIGIIRPFGIKELIRTGKVALAHVKK